MQLIPVFCSVAVWHKQFMFIISHANLPRSFGAIMASSEKPRDKAKDLNFSIRSGLSMDDRPRSNVSDRLACFINMSKTAYVIYLLHHQFRLTIKSYLSVLFVHVLVFKDQTIISVIGLHYRDVFCYLVPLTKGQIYHVNFKLRDVMHV